MRRSTDPRPPTSSTGPRRPASVGRRALGRLAPRLIRPRPGHVCLASIPDFTDSAYWVYRHLLASRTGLRFTWLLHDTGHADRVESDFRESGRSQHHELQVLDWHNPAAYRAFLRSAVVFHTHGVFNFSQSRRGRQVVSLWHGMPIKAVGELDDSDLWANDVGGDIHVASSRLFRPVVAAAFGVHPRSVLTTGLPRCDVLKRLVPPSSDREAIASALDLDPARPILVWLPTHRRDKDAAHSRSFLDQVDSGAVDTLIGWCRSREVELVIKLHPLDLLNERGTERLTAGRTVRLVSSRDWDRSGVQLYDLLACADGLVTDISSALIDFLHTGRPIGMFGFQESTYERSLILPVDHLSTSAAVFSLREADDVATFVDRVRDPRPIELPTDDVAHWLNEDAAAISSELIAQKAGL